MKISNNGLNLIKEFEGCRLTAYRCPAGRLTIGFGHTGNDVKVNMKISQKRANELLKKDVEKFEKIVTKYYSKYNWNQNQFDALVSFAYNIGSIDQLTNNGKRTIADISAKITAYNKDINGCVLNGLARRRKAEKKLFDTPEKNTIVIMEKVAFRTEKEVNPNNRVCFIPKNTEVILLSTVDDKWLKIKYNGKNGYIVKSKTNLR